MKYIITHGEKGSGADPSLTEEARWRIEHLPIPKNIRHIVTGTGRRFLHTLECVVGVLVARNRGESINIPMQFSPLCGSADSGERSETGFRVLLADGTVLEPGQYIGLIGTPGIDLKAWLDSLPESTLLISGREFLGGIGYKDAEPGKVYVYQDGEVFLINK